MIIFPFNCPKIEFESEFYEKKFDELKNKLSSKQYLLNSNPLKQDVVEVNTGFLLSTKKTSDFRTISEKMNAKRPKLEQRLEGFRYKETIFKERRDIQIRMVKQQNADFMLIHFFKNSDNYQIEHQKNEKVNSKLKLTCFIKQNQPQEKNESSDTFQIQHQQPNQQLFEPQNLPSFQEPEKQQPFQNQKMQHPIEAQNEQLHFSHYPQNKNPQLITNIKYENLDQLKYQYSNQNMQQQQIAQQQDESYKYLYDQQKQNQSFYLQKKQASFSNQYQNVQQNDDLNISLNQSLLKQSNQQLQQQQNEQLQQQQRQLPLYPQISILQQIDEQNQQHNQYQQKQDLSIVQEKKKQTVEEIKIQMKQEFIEQDSNTKNKQLLEENKLLKSLLEKQAISELEKEYKIKQLETENIKMRLENLKKQQQLNNIKKSSKYDFVSCED